MKSNIFVIPFVAALSGCLGYKPFQPPPAPSKSWTKGRTSEVDVAAALLECGVIEPRARVPGLKERMSHDETALALLCMEHDGFRAKYGNSYADFCRNFQGTPSCLPNTLPPKRDVNKRLGSAFCRAFPNADVCS
jgi:hypothetical protein